jgi:hypothetical protein
MASNGLSARNKWLVSLLSAALFMVVASPMMYKITNKLTSPLGLKTSSNGCPNLGGLILHGVVFLLLTQLLMFIPTGQLVLAAIIAVGVAVVLNVLNSKA